ncbi:MAG: hypothetical protein NPIRA03_38250 [Nitrospirales bacterium]|nr:MAG: hypothetical protein NPIRA03_38250 [Nitrospirales bacterium]
MKVMKHAQHKAMKRNRQQDIERLATDLQTECLKRKKDERKFLGDG